MSVDFESVKVVFQTAVAEHRPDEWDGYLEEACGGDADLRREVKDLLRAHHEGGSLLERPALANGHQTISSLTEGPGTDIGAYKLLQQIGEGGMGVVFMAEQTEPIQRTVALKIIKPGMDTRQVIARFEAERQAVAMMDHPNIAKVLDAGTTDSGRPYFVMELVKGIPITEYCDEKHLPIRARLELLMQVCQAVQHAHQKGIIHRDIKPNNVLVAEYDNQAVPKVIDFGVAKATAQKLTERTMFTEFGQVLGTMEYMSPEQSKFNQLDIDTRSDIYSLGVMLYELLAGSTPFEGKRLHEAAFDEMLRIIREEEPPKPSTRLSSLSLGERAGVRVPSSLASIAANRHLEPHKLTAIVRGDLDWIVMKCLEKDRNRRYETASGFATDLHRYLNNEPVDACPPSRAYRFRKFVRRNKAAFFAAIAAIATLLFLTLGLIISNRLINAERNETAKALAEKQVALALAEAQGKRASKNFWRASVAIRELMAKLASRGNLLPPSIRKQFSDEAIKYYQTLLHESTPDSSLRYEAAVGYRSLAIIHATWGDLVQAERCYLQAIAILDQLVRENPTSQQYRQQLGYALARYSPRLKELGRLQESHDASKRAQQIYEKLLAETPDSFDYTYELADLLKSLIEIESAAGRLADAEKAYARCCELIQRLMDGRTSPDPYPAAHEGGFLLAYLGKTQMSWAIMLGKAGRFDDAQHVFRQAIRTFEELAARSPVVVESWSLLAESHRQLGLVSIDRNQPKEAESQFRQAIAIHQQRADKFPEERLGNREWSAAYLDLAQLLIKSGRTEDAVPLVSRSIEVDPDHTNTDEKKLLLELEGTANQKN